VDAYHKKFGFNPPRGFSLHIGKIYTPPVRNLLHFMVLQLTYRRVRQTDFYAQYVNWRGFAQGSAFFMLQNKNLIFDLFIRKTRKNYNGAYGKNFKIL